MRVAAEDSRGWAPGAAEPENSSVFTRVQQAPAFSQAPVPASTWFYVVSGIYTCYVWKDGFMGSYCMKWGLLLLYLLCSRKRLLFGQVYRELTPFFLIMFISKGCLCVKGFCPYV